MSEQQYIVKMTGIPYSATTEDVAIFLAGLDILGGRKNGVHLTKDRTGRASGECYVELTCAEDLKLALKKNRDYMGERWVSVVESNGEDMQADMENADKAKAQLENSGVYIVKIRGIPWSCTVDDLAGFFAGSQLKVDSNSSVHILRNEEGRLTGQAFVEFADDDSLQGALARDHQHMGKRYLEIERSDEKSLRKMTSMVGVGAKFKEPIIMCRGLPFSVTENDVYSFFSGLDIKSLQMVYDQDGIRPAGKCFIEFTATTESDKALKKHGEKIGSRYVEVFQSNSKYWYDREMGGPGSGMPFGAGRGEAAMPRPPRARPTPYTRHSYEEPSQEMGYGGGAMRRGGMRGRVKHITHGRGGGYDGSAGYEGADAFPIQKFGSAAVGSGAKSGPTKHNVLVKGVPMDASMGDIIKFFTDSNPPKNVEMKFGEALVEFNTHADAMMAMLKDKTPLAGVRITLELQSKPEDYTGYDVMSAQAMQQPGMTEQFADPYSAADPYAAAPLVGGGYRW